MNIRRITTPQTRFLWMSSALSLALLAVLLLLHGCGAADAAARPDPYARYRPALKPEFQRELDELGPAPEYTIEATLDPEELKLTGRASVVVPNTSICLLYTSPSPRD